MLQNFRYGVALVGVRPAELPEFYEDTILLNPGPRHVMKKSDICYYLSITKEENSSFVVHASNQTAVEIPVAQKTEKQPDGKITTIGFFSHCEKLSTKLFCLPCSYRVR